MKQNNRKIDNDQLDQMNGVLALDDEQVEAFRVLESHRGALDVGKYRTISNTKSLLKPPTESLNNWMRNSNRPKVKRPPITARLNN